MSRPPLPSTVRRLLAASGVSAAGDGIMIVALPLLATQATKSPFWIAAVAAAQQLPWLMFGVAAGVRVDRRRPVPVMVVADLGRAAAVGLLALAAATGNASVPLLLAVAFALGTGDILFSPAAATAIPALAGETQLARVYAASTAVGTAGETGVGPIAGGLLFRLGHSIPFVADAISFGLSALLLRGIPSPDAPASDEQAPSVRGALRWYLGQRSLLILNGFVMVMALTQAMVMSILVLIGTERLGLDDGEYGVFYAVTAVGSVLGGMVAERAWSALGTRSTLLGAALVSILGFVVVARSTELAVVTVALFAEAFVVPVGSVVTMTKRQLLAPPERRGQAANIFRLFVLGCVPMGALLSGTVASHWEPADSVMLAAVLAGVAMVALAGPILARPEFAGGPPTESDD